MSLITSENQVVCFPSFVLTVFWYSTSYTVIIVFWLMLMEPLDAPARWWPCARHRHCACVLREVLAASKQVNLPVTTGKLHVTQVNCARDLFTCELHVKLPAFAGNFARASFTVYHLVHLNCPNLARISTNYNPKNKSDFSLIVFEHFYDPFQKEKVWSNINDHPEEPMGYTKSQCWFKCSFSETAQISTNKRGCRADTSVKPVLLPAFG